MNTQRKDETGRNLTQSEIDRENRWEAEGKADAIRRAVLPTFAEDESRPGTFLVQHRGTTWRICPIMRNPAPFWQCGEKADEDEWPAESNWYTESKSTTLITSAPMIRDLLQYIVLMAG